VVLWPAWPGPALARGDPENCVEPAHRPGLARADRSQRPAGKGRPGSKLGLKPYG